MGSKRYFEEGNFQELSHKHPKLVNPTETYPCRELTRKADLPVESDGFYFGFESKVSHLTEKEAEISVPYSWVTSSSSEEEGGPSAAVSSSFSAENLEVHSPSRSNVQSADTHTYSLNGTPAIQIPVGPGYQAELPVWDPQVIKKCPNRYDQLMGDCVVSLLGKESNAQVEVRAGEARKGCDCPDEGLATCVKQHVREARQRLRADLGPEKFVKLGFCDMGDDISQLWNEEEERVFHEVVYSNSVSHNKSFWDRLSVVFPSRTKKEIVSYYFNVFILRRRSFQNRSNFLEVDSDDDEWNVGYWDPVECAREEDSRSNSPNINEVNYQDDLPVVNVVDNNEDCKEDLQGNVASSSADGFSDSYVMEPLHEAEEKEGDYNDDLHENIARSASADGFGSSYQIEQSHGKFWDDGFQVSPLRFNEFLSTGQMIEELFGASPNSGSLF